MNIWMFTTLVVGTHMVAITIGIITGWLMHRDREEFDAFLRRGQGIYRAKDSKERLKVPDPQADFTDSEPTETIPVIVPVETVAELLDVPESNNPPYIGKHR